MKAFLTLYLNNGIIYFLNKDQKLEILKEEIQPKEKKYKLIAKACGIKEINDEKYHVIKFYEESTLSNPSLLC